MNNSFLLGLQHGSNTKAAIIRIGVEEMRLFASLFFDGVLEDTFLDSAGYADVITTCFGGKRLFTLRYKVICHQLGRNVRCAAEFVRRKGRDDWSKIEADLLNGQKLQGQLTCEEVYHVIEHNKLHDMFPMFTTIYKISFEGMAPESLIDRLAVEEFRSMKTRQACTPCPLVRSHFHPTAVSNVGL